MMWICGITSSMRTSCHRRYGCGTIRRPGGVMGSLRTTVAAGNRFAKYDAWGNIISATSTVLALATNRYRFQGREWSAVTGLTNFRMRWYDAETGRWLSKDPIGLSGGLNLYAFCGDNPIQHADPLGQNWLSDNVVVPIAKGMSDHWNRNVGVNDPSVLPKSPSAAESAGRRLLPPSQSVYHNRNGATNKKYISPDGHQEAVYNQHDELVTDPINMGTYNICSPEDKLGHFIFDMMPYYFIGNSSADAFNYKDRLKATIESIILAIKAM